MARARRGRALAGTTVRYVDSSVERLQVHGDRPDRRSLRRHLQRPRACRCSRPARNGEYVAGVRYRAWQPPSCLHPTIPVHAPLTFDSSTPGCERSLGGCQYHVMHPGGRSYEQFPVNSYEAESRRLARFFTLGHTPGRMTASAAGAQPRVSVHARSADAWPDLRMPTPIDDPMPPASRSRRRCSPAITVPGRATSTSCSTAPRRAARRTGRRSRAHAGDLTARQLDARAGARRAADPRERRHLQRLRGAPTAGAAVDARRPAASSCRPAEWERAGARACASARGCSNAIAADLYGAAAAAERGR